MSYILPYLGMTVVFFTIDMLWLGLIAKPIYQKYLGYLLADQVQWGPAIVFYLLFILGIFIFAVLPSAEQNSWRMAVILGGLFGFFCYATYDLTNWATIRDWPWQIVFIDMAWGMVLSSIVSVAGFFIAQKTV